MKQVPAPGAPGCWIPRGPTLAQGQAPALSLGTHAGRGSSWCLPARACPAGPRSLRHVAGCDQLWMASTPGKAANSPPLSSSPCRCGGKELLGVSRSSSESGAPRSKAAREDLPASGASPSADSGPTEGGEARRTPTHPGSGGDHAGGGFNRPNRPWAHEGCGTHPPPDSAVLLVHRQ